MLVEKAYIMAKCWKEQKTKTHWPNELTPSYHYYVEVCQFTFNFQTIEQIKETRDWFSQKIHKSTRLPDTLWLRAEHDVAQRWYERLPARIKKASKRARVVAALEQAVNHFSE